jgi:hypothetical protein
MKWRAINDNGMIIEGGSYQEIRTILMNKDNSEIWAIEYYDSDNEWIELEKLSFTPNTGEILVTRGSHKEHAA